MANSITIAIILALTVIFTSATAPESPTQCQNPNETYSPCEDPCPKTCANEYREPNRCLAVCKSEGACVCKSGYIRGWNHTCIKPEECPTCEGPNEFYSCGSACDTTCQTLLEKCPIVNIKCNEMCYCKEGFARDSKGVCIPIGQCPPRQCKQDPNAIIANCGDPCPLTCENKDDTRARPCPAICLLNGCKCKDGFVKGSADKCIPVESCPESIKCEKEEIYDSCPLECPPEETCISYMYGITPMCSIQTKCVPACICKEGYIRNYHKGKCIPINGCCNELNSEMVSCPDPCPGRTCNQPETTPCEMACNYRGCQCKKGFVKKSESNPKCVAIDDCKLPSHK